jgi:hypothetical protein
MGLSLTFPNRIIGSAAFNGMKYEAERRSGGVEISFILPGYR